MAQYVIRKNKGEVLLAKFENTDTPTDVYSISEKGCNCPARSRACKHTKIASAWKRSGEPIGVIYNDSAEVLGVLSVS